MIDEKIGLFFFLFEAKKLRITAPVFLWGAVAT